MCLPFSPWRPHLQFLQICPYGVVWRLIVTSLSLSGWVCLSFWERSSSQNWTWYERPYFHQTERGTFPSRPISRLQDGGYQNEPEEAWPHPNVLWVPLYWDQTPNVAAYLTSSDTSHSAPPGFTVGETHQANFQVASCSFFPFILYFCNLFIRPRGVFLGMKYFGDKRLGAVFSEQLSLPTTCLGSGFNHPGAHSWDGHRPKTSVTALKMTSKATLIPSLWVLNRVPIDCRSWSGKFEWTLTAV